MVTKLTQKRRLMLLLLFALVLVAAVVVALALMHVGATIQHVHHLLADATPDVISPHH